MSLRFPSSPVPFSNLKAGYIIGFWTLSDDLEWVQRMKPCFQTQCSQGGRVVMWTTATRRMRVYLPSGREDCDVGTIVLDAHPVFDDDSWWPDVKEEINPSSCSALRNEEGESRLTSLWLPSRSVWEWVQCSQAHEGRVCPSEWKLRPQISVHLDWWLRFMESYYYFKITP